LSTEVKSGYAAVNGIKLYYELQGTGEPLILLHGGLGSTGAVAGILGQLSKHRQAIAVDLYGHGRTALTDRPIHTESMADDVAALIRFLGIEKADLMGYSLGAGVSLRVTIRHPSLVGKLAVVSTVFKRDGWFPEVLAAMDKMGPAAAEMMKPSPLYQLYARIAPRPEDWTALVTRIAEALRRDFDLSKDVAAITAPTLLVFGDADAIRPAHIVEFFGLLGGGKTDAGWDGSGMSRSRLAILPGVTHYNMLESPLLAQVAGPFFGIPALLK
jgi:pimeloyl-ACP methyl ester carboxylesterase